MQQLLEFNPTKRLTVEDALAHPYLEAYRLPEHEPLCASKFDYTAVEKHKAACCDERQSAKQHEGQAARQTQQLLRELLYDEIHCFDKPITHGAGSGLSSPERMARLRPSGSDTAATSQAREAPREPVPRTPGGMQPAQQPQVRARDADAHQEAVKAATNAYMARLCRIQNERNAAVHSARRRLVWRARSGVSVRVFRRLRRRVLLASVLQAAS